MVTRVDRKPIIYGTTLVKLLSPGVESHNQTLTRAICDKVVGYGIPKIDAGMLPDFEERIKHSLWAYGDKDTFFETNRVHMTDEDTETYRIANAIHRKHRNMRAQLRAGRLSDALAKVLGSLVSESETIVCGIEAAYVMWHYTVLGKIFNPAKGAQNDKWARDCTKEVSRVQGPYMMIHPSIIDHYASFYNGESSTQLLNVMTMSRQTESLLLKTHSAKAWQASAYYMGVLRKKFSPSDDPKEDFEVKPAGLCELAAGVKVYVVAGLRIVTVDGLMIVLSVDDAISCSLLASCLTKMMLYFQPANGYQRGVDVKALRIAMDSYSHISKQIGCGQDFGKYIRSIHILAQKEFNDSMEDMTTECLGWKVRSKNYTSESVMLDPYGKATHAKVMALARCDLDKLNVMFFYHILLGDDVLSADLLAKIVDMPKKVRIADKVAWSHFLNFCDAYLLTRFLYVRKVKPRVGGDSSILSEPWATRTLEGKFTMLPEDKWGQVWIEKHMPYVKHADTWHLNCQDVSLVMKDADGVSKGEYNARPECNVELIHALQSGDILNTLTGSTPTSARDRICSRSSKEQVVMTVASKQENAKHSSKKRATFSADNESRKMQAELDRNIRAVGSFLKGPSLGADQVLIEKQMKNIAVKTGMGTGTTCSSHDISAWSESEDRKQKFEFMRRLARMTTREEMSNIEEDWLDVVVCVNKQGMQEIVKVGNGYFQGFDGSEATIKHSLMLLYTIHTARAKAIIPSKVKTDMAVLIDDCVALMEGLPPGDESAAFWVHLKATYLSLGKEVDDLKSVYSCIKAVYLSRRFVKGGEAPADFKVFVKVHNNYEDPLRTSLSIPGDTFSSMRGACDAGGAPWFTYMAALHISFWELSFSCPLLMQCPPQCISVIALAPYSENGWNFPSLLSWVTTEVYDERTHFNSIMEVAAAITSMPGATQVRLITNSHCSAFSAIKEQPWRTVTLGSLFSDPMHAQRDGPQNPNFARATLVEEILDSVCTSEPWVSILKWNKSELTNEVREVLVSTGPLHAPTLKALANCMPDSWRQALIGKAVGSTSILELVPKTQRSKMKRRITRMSDVYLTHLPRRAMQMLRVYECADIASLTGVQRAMAEREEFYSLNGATLTDHTHPDPFSVFTRARRQQEMYCRPEMKYTYTWDQAQTKNKMLKDHLGMKGLFVPPRSERVWESSSEYAKGWDPISNKVSVCAAVLLRAHVDGHGVLGLVEYATKAWSTAADFSLDNPQLTSIHGSIKRLDSNPGSSTHPITAYRNISPSLDCSVTTLAQTLKGHAKAIGGTESTLHDVLSHTVALRAVCVLQLDLFYMCDGADEECVYHLLVRPDCVVPCSQDKMRTDGVASLIVSKIMDSGDHYGLAEAAPKLAPRILESVVYKMWVRRVNAMVNADSEELCTVDKELELLNPDELVRNAKEKIIELSASIRVATAPRERATVDIRKLRAVFAYQNAPDVREIQDGYQHGVSRSDIHVARQISREQTRQAAVASVVRSCIWQALKGENITDLAQIYYRDEDASLAPAARALSKGVWKKVVRNTRPLLRGHDIHEVLPQAFSSLGMHGLRMAAKESDDQIVQQLASYAGAHMHDVVAVVGGYITSIAGRRPGDFKEDNRFLILSRNPEAENKRIRRKILEDMFLHNIQSLKERIKALESGDTKHAGDKRVTKPKARLTELRVRRSVYKTTKVTGASKAEYDFHALGEFTRRAAFKSIMRNDGLLDSEGKDEILLESYKVTDRESLLTLIDHLEPMVVDRGGSWFPEAAHVGVATALAWIDADCEKVSGTKYAILASDVMPAIHRVITHPAGDGTVAVTPEENPEDDEDVVAPWGVSAVAEFEDGEEEDTEALFGYDTVGVEKKQRPSPIALWKCIYTLAMMGEIRVKDVSKFFGGKDSVDESVDALNASGVIGASDDIALMFRPHALMDYVVAGGLFDPSWIDAGSGFLSSEK